MIKQKQEFLDILKKEYGNIRVHYVNIPFDKLWQTDKTLNELSKLELVQVNLRRIKSEEMILDLEEKERLQEIIEKLDKKKWSYEVWDTGSRGYHIHMIFNELLNYNLETIHRCQKSKLAQ